MKEYPYNSISRVAGFADEAEAVLFIVSPKRDDRPASLILCAELICVCKSVHGAT
jgi:hypothetical protein